MPELCADPKHPRTENWGCDSLTVGSRLGAVPSSSPTGSALSHPHLALAHLDQSLRKKGWMKQLTQEMLLNLSKQPQGLLWLCDSFSLLLWGLSAQFSCFPSSC